MLNAWTDGSIQDGAWGSKERKGLEPHAYSGWVVKELDGTHVRHHALDVGVGPTKSGNVAEYMALRSVLHWLVLNRPLEVAVIHADSQLLVNQMSGQFNCYKPNLIILRDACRNLAAKLAGVRYKWVPREENVEADCLSKAYQIWGYIPTWQEVQDQLTKPKKRKK